MMMIMVVMITLAVVIIMMILMMTACSIVPHCMLCTAVNNTVFVPFIYLPSLLMQNSTIFILLFYAVTSTHLSYFVIKSHFFILPFLPDFSYIFLFYDLLI